MPPGTLLRHVSNLFIRNTETDSAGTGDGLGVEEGIKRRE